MNKHLPIVINKDPFLKNALTNHYECKQVFYCDKVQYRLNKTTCII